jgi:hypothetical protein
MLQDGINTWFPGFTDYTMMLHANTFFNRSSIEIKISLILLSILIKTSHLSHLRWAVSMTCGMP